MGRDEGHVKGIPCSPTWLCEPQTTVGLCTCTLGWGSAVKNGHGRGGVRTPAYLDSQ